jgi:hypothetical protein
LSGAVSVAAPHPTSSPHRRGSHRRLSRANRLVTGGSPNGAIGRSCRGRQAAPRAHCRRPPPVGLPQLRARVRGQQSRMTGLGRERRSDHLIGPPVIACRETTWAASRTSPASPAAVTARSRPRRSSPKLYDTQETGRLRRHCCGARLVDHRCRGLVHRVDQHRHDLAVVPPQPLRAGIGVPVQHLDGERVDARTP